MEDWKAGDLFIADNGSRRRIGMVIKMDRVLEKDSLRFMLFRGFGNGDMFLTFSDNFIDYIGYDSEMPDWKVTKIDIDMNRVVDLLEESFDIDRET